MKKIFAFILVIISLLLLASCGNKEGNIFHFSIPAGTSETFVFSNQEISPTGSKITLSTDTEVVIKFSQVREENAYEMITEPLVQGTPVEIPLEKDTWYKIGVTIESPLDVDTVVNIEVSGIKVRDESSIPTGVATSDIISQENNAYSPLLENVELQLPECIERESFSGTRDYFYNNGEIVGGIELLNTAGQRDTLPNEDEYTELAITVTRQVHDGEYDCSVDKDSAIADVKVEIKFQDERTFFHYFFFGENVVYDVWVDHDVLDSQDMISILKTLHSEDIVNPQDNAPANEDTPILNLRIDLPEGMIHVPATSSRILFFNVPWEEYLNRGNAVGGIEALADATDLDTLESVIADLGQLHLENEFVAATQEFSGINVVAKVTANSAETELIAYVVEVDGDAYAIWADTAIISEEDVLKIAEGCSY